MDGTGATNGDVNAAAAVARRVAKSVVRVLSSAVIRLVGSEVPTDFDRRSCVVLAPHPDDETFGCGATIARKCAAGTDVRVVIVTDGSRSPHVESITGRELVAVREHEALAALACLGVPRSGVTFLGFEDGTLSEQVDAVAAAIGECAAATGADQVLVTSVDDRHPDHRALGNAARLARERGELVGDLHEYAIWQRVPAVRVLVRVARAGMGRARAGTPRVAPRPLLVSTRGVLDRKRAAIDAYESQLPLLPIGFVEDFLQRHEVFVRV